MQSYFVAQVSPMLASGGQDDGQYGQKVTPVWLGHKSAGSCGGQQRTVSTCLFGGQGQLVTPPDRSCSIHRISIAASGWAEPAAVPICSPLNVRMLKLKEEVAGVRVRARVLKATGRGDFHPL